MQEVRKVVVNKMKQNKTLIIIIMSLMLLMMSTYIVLTGKGIAFLIISIAVIVVLAFVFGKLYKKFAKNKESLINPGFDEYQTHIRNKYGFRSCIFMSILVFVDAYISTDYDYAEPMVKAFLIIYITMFYFTTMLILKGAYYSCNRENEDFRLSIANLVVGLSLVVMAILSAENMGIKYLYENGMLQYGVCAVGTAIFMLYTSLLSLLIYFKNRKE